jgi:hypothetical protein
METSPLFKVFMQPSNIESIQAEIQRQVKNEIGVAIAPQDESSLRVIMNTSYVNLNQDPGHDFESQVNVMNADTVRFVLKDIIPKIKMNKYYLSNLGKLPAPLQLPANMSNAGRRVNEQKTGLY